MMVDGCLYLEVSYSFSDYFLLS